MNYDHVLILGFGGPQSPEEVMPFLRRIAAGKNIPEKRLLEVATHYAIFGGKSPYTEYALGFADVLASQLSAGGCSLRVFSAMRYSNPLISETIGTIKDLALTRGIAVILAAHRSLASCRVYKEALAASCRDLGVSGLHYDYLGPWFDETDFTGAFADRVREALPAGSPEGVTLLFSAHSIPQSWDGRCSSCHYSAEVERSSRLIADDLGIQDWHIGYQSQSGGGQEPWLGPSVESLMKDLAAKGKRKIMVVPVGFLCDHIEVLYDLDHELGLTAQSLGIEYLRARTVIDHPRFVRLIALKVGEKLKNSTSNHPNIKDCLSFST